MAAAFHTDGGLKRVRHHLSRGRWRT